MQRQLHQKRPPLLIFLVLVILFELNLFFIIDGDRHEFDLLLDHTLHKLIWRRLIKVGHVIQLKERERFLFRDGQF